MKNQLPEEIEIFRDHKWRRSPDLKVESGVEAESLIEAVGFCAALTDARRGGPSIYVAVCGRRDAHLPRNVQKDPEASLAWVIKDEVMKRGRVYYAKLAKNRATFVARRLIPHFNAVWGIARKEEANKLSDEARAVLKVLRKEWEMATCDLRMESGVTDRTRFTRAMDELQAAMKVIPADVLYEPYFTYIWTLAEGRFAEELKVKVKREAALREIARAFLDGAGMTVRGELARITGLSRVDAGRGNQMLVKESYAEQMDVGVYRLKNFEKKAADSEQFIE
jgi:hypothetical protein